jgi:hypothetical protein
MTTFYLTVDATLEGVRPFEATERAFDDRRYAVDGYGRMYRVGTHAFESRADAYRDALRQVSKAIAEAKSGLARLSAMDQRLRSEEAKR